VIVVIFSLSLPAVLQAQTNINHPPLITSQAITSIVAGETYKYVATATDRDGQTVSWRLTEGPKNMTLDQSTITWQPTKVGTYNVVIEVTDQNGGYDTQAWQITVSPAAAATLVISPNEKPTNVNLGSSQKFSVLAYDQFHNEVSTQGLVWSVDTAIGTIDKDGTFVAKRGGLGSVTATLGSLKASAGIAVKDIRPSLVTVTNTNSSSNNNTNASNQESSFTVNTATNTNATANTNTQETLNSATNSNTNTENADKNTEPCTNMAHWLIILILIIYPIMLAIYYDYEKRHRSGGWWLFPLFVTIIGLIIYYKYICAGTYLWWPWILAGLGIALTWWYKGKHHPQNFDSQEKLPF